VQTFAGIAPMAVALSPRRWPVAPRDKHWKRREQSEAGRIDLPQCNNG
jgi:hypothetical protein